MTIRESLELREKEYLSPYASLSMNTKGRLKPEEECDIRPAFQRDRDKILHCKAFRRLKDKTQVFLSPEGRPLPYQTDSYAGGFPECENHCQGAEAE